MFRWNTFILGLGNTDFGRHLDFWRGRLILGLRCTGRVIFFLIGCWDWDSDRGRNWVFVEIWVTIWVLATCIWGRNWRLWLGWLGRSRRRHLMNALIKFIINGGSLGIIWFGILLMYYLNIKFIFWLRLWVLLMCLLWIHSLLFWPLFLSISFCRYLQFVFFVLWCPIRRLEWFSILHNLVLVAGNAHDAHFPFCLW